MTRDAVPSVLRRPAGLEVHLSLGLMASESRLLVAADTLACCRFL